MKSIRNTRVPRLRPKHGVFCFLISRVPRLNPELNAHRRRGGNGHGGRGRNDSGRDEASASRGQNPWVGYFDPMGCVVPTPSCALGASKLCRHPRVPTWCVNAGVPGHVLWHASCSVRRPFVRPPPYVAFPPTLKWIMDT